VPVSAYALVLGYTSIAHRTYRMRRATVPEVKIAAEVREEFGKGAARRARQEGHVPAVLYGHGTQTRHLSLPGHDVMLALKTPNVLIRLEGLKGGSELALPKAVQRDAVKGFIEHVDLILVRRGEKVTVEVPINVIGEIQSGGVLDQQLVQVTVEAEATHIPQGIDVDVEGMEVGAAVHAGDLTLPHGTSLQLEPDTLILHVIAPAAAEEQAETEGEAPEAPPAPVSDTAARGEGE
jgi:large subunit ribosomal protein L25